MKTIRSILVASALGLILVPNLAHPEDIDLYTGTSSGGDSNVLIVLDNSANWSATINSAPPDDDAIAICGSNDAKTYFCAQKVALIRLLEQKYAEKYVLGSNVGIGLMLFNDASNSIKGGYIRFGVRKMTDRNRAALIALLGKTPTAGLQIGTDTSNGQENYGRVMWEAYKYFGGGKGSPASQTGWGAVPSAASLAPPSRDYENNSTAGSAHSAGADSPFAYTTSSTDANVVRYNSPASDTCAKNYVVALSHNDSQNDNASSDAATWFGNVNGGTSSNRVVAGRSEVDASFGDEAAKFMFNSDVNPADGTQRVATYTIGQYNGTPNGTQRAMVKLMKSMAQQGGGSYYAATSIDELYKAFLDIATEIQSVNSVFVSASLPVSVNTQGTFLNQVYVGMFRPDAAGSPKWMGNVKQFQLKYSTTTGAVRLADADDLDAIDAGTGFVSVLARSYWTTPSTFWNKWVPAKTATASDFKDGPEVQKGGAAQRQRETNLTTQASRPVYTCAVDANGDPACVGDADLSGTPFNTTTLSPAITGTQKALNYKAAWKTPTTASPDIDDLIAWARGTDNLGNESGPGGTTTVRPTIHGDVLHSRPVALNYGGGTPPRVVVFYGSNDGMLRAIEGKQTGTGAGNELWAFVVPETLRKLNRLRDETPKLVIPSNPAGSPNNKDYFLDGPIGAYQEGGKAMIYVAARRGGNFIYAFDVSNPDKPKYKFRLSPSTAGLENLGQTWSMPKVTKVRDGGSGKVVLIFGGGYDVAEDSDTHGTTGQGVYVVDALTGAFIKRFNAASDGTNSISTSIPSDVTIVNTDRDAKGFADRAYVGDMAGNVWRMDLDDPTSTTNDPDGWKLHKLATLGAGKFFFPPDVVLGASYHAVLIGSGDREKPLSESSSDRFYMIKDAKLGLVGTEQTPIVPADLVVNTADSSTKKGWYYDFSRGEKVVNAPLTIGGVVYFGTNNPNYPTIPNNVLPACTSDLGQARSYAMSFLDGSGTRAPGGVDSGDDAYSLVLTGGGLPPSPIAGLVDIDGTIVPVCLGCGDRRSAFEAGSPPIDPNPVRRKIYWKFLNDK